MAAPVGAVSAPNGPQYAVAVVGKQHDQQKVEGQQAVQLIQSATAPQLATSGSVGTKLHFTA
ncbi:MAG: hypothetical protein ABUL62_23430 [Myxococcales bacterium]